MLDVAGKPIAGPRSGYIIACEGGYYLGQRKKGLAVDLKGNAIRKFKGGDIVQLHVQNFIDAVQSRDFGLLNAPVEMGHHSTGWCNLANVAFRAAAAYDRKQISSAGSLAAWPLLIEEMERQLAPFEVPTSALVSSPTLSHDPKTERFVGDQADLGNSVLQRTYRSRYAVKQT